MKWTINWRRRKANVQVLVTGDKSIVKYKNSRENAHRKSGSVGRTR